MPTEKTDYFPILCLDFDGVIHSYTTGWQGAAVIPDPPVYGAEQFILEAMEKFQVVVFSSRSHQDGGALAMANYLVRQVGIPQGFIEWPSLSKKITAVYARTPDPRRVTTHPRPIQFPLEKPPALVTLDDRGIQFKGAWPKVSALLKFTPWNKGRSKPKRRQKNLTTNGELDLGPTRARTTDPVTSHESVPKISQKARKIQIVRWYDKGPIWQSTFFTVAEAFGVDVQNISNNFRDMQRMGLLVENGYEPADPSRRRGRRIIWAITPLGRKVARRGGFGQDRGKS